MSKFDLLQAVLWSLAVIWLAVAAKLELRKRNRVIEKQWGGEK